jgi:septal ring factor EnvC (AmiA/AmiB activator)
MLGQRMARTNLEDMKMAEFQAGDNPADHSVEEINAYLARDDVDAAEKQRVVDAEAAGKNRSSVKYQPESPADQTPVDSQTVTDGTAADTESAFPVGGSKPYWYEETQGPAPEGAEDTYTVVRVNQG